jgi:hypothetical protein
MNVSEIQPFVNILTLILGIIFLNIKGKKGYYYLLLAIWFTPIFWIILGFLVPEKPTRKTRIVSIISFLIGVGTLWLIFIQQL